MLISKEMDSWVVILPKQLRHDVTRFVSLLRTAAHGMEFRLSTPAYQELPDSHIASYVEGIAKALLACNPRLILAVLPNSRLDLYRCVQKDWSIQTNRDSQLLGLKMSCMLTVPLRRCAAWITQFQPSWFFTGI